VGKGGGGGAAAAAAAGVGGGAAAAVGGGGAAAAAAGGIGGAAEGGGGGAPDPRYVTAATDLKDFIENGGNSWQPLNDGNWKSTAGNRPVLYRFWNRAKKGKTKPIQVSLKANEMFFEGYGDFKIAYQETRGKGQGRGIPRQDFAKGSREGKERVIVKVEKMGGKLIPLKWYYTNDHYVNIIEGGDF